MTSLASKICAEIQKAGAVPFATFMEMALYCPDLGYYERQEEIGQRGDFYTSVSVGNLFGELLAFQFAEWFSETLNSQNSTLNLVEAGAHNGQLARDILNWLQKFQPRIFEQVEYSILEPSMKRREWQKENLAEFSDKISWSVDCSGVPQSISSVPRFTICFSNELFDAMPVHRFGWNREVKIWFEWGVAWDGNNFVWERLSENQRSLIAPPKLPDELLEVLPDGFIFEICPAANAWWKEAASIVNPDKLLAIDYGLLADELFSPQRSNGTLRAYFRHHLNPDLLASPGEQDLTAHINFTALKEAGESAGLKTDALISQTKFLAEIAAKTMSRPESFGKWNEKRAKQFQTLTHPEHLGRSFRVLIQSR